MTLRLECLPSFDISDDAGTLSLFARIIRVYVMRVIAGGDAIYIYIRRERSENPEGMMAPYIICARAI